MAKLKRNYINPNTGEIKEFKQGKQPEGWEFLPPMERWLDDDNKFHLRVHFDDATIEIIETDEPTEADLIDGEVVEDGNTDTN